MTHAQQLREDAERIYSGQADAAMAKRIIGIAAEIEALNAITPDIDPLRDHPEHHMKWTATEIRWIKTYAQKAVHAALDARVPMTDEQRAMLIIEHFGPHALSGDGMSIWDSIHKTIDAVESQHNITSKE